MFTQSPLSRMLLAGAAASLLGTLTFADTTTVSASVPLQNTNWSTTLTIPKFNTSLGVLTSVTLRSETAIQGTVGVENTSNNTTNTFTVNQFAQVNVLTPGGGGTLISSNPSNPPVVVPPLAAFDGNTNFQGPSGFTSPLNTATDNDSLSIPPDGLMALADFVGPGSLVFPVAAQGSSAATGNTGNEAFLFTLQASARLVVTYNYTPPKSECEPLGRDVPGSLLLFPRYDNRPNNLTVITVTNTNCDFATGQSQLPAGTVDVEFVYIARYGQGGEDLPCLETNITRRLTPCDTISVVTRFDNPNAGRGFLYAFAKSPTTGQAIVFNHLIGQALFIGGGDLGEDPSRDALNARVFLGIGRPGSTTDDDGDGIRDLDGTEYSKAPDEILIPRFLGQDQQGGDSAVPTFKSRLVLVGLSGGSQFTTIVYILGYNDNEVPFSEQYSFRCWDDPKLSDISGGFNESYLDTTDNAPGEIIGSPNKESGWIRIDGQVAFTSADQIDDPAIYAVLFERYGQYVVCDLPWELCTQDNGDLFPNGLFEE